jgi:hypothetical protein
MVTLTGFNAMTSILYNLRRAAGANSV